MQPAKDRFGADGVRLRAAVMPAMWPISTAFGAAWLQAYRVWTNEISDVAAAQLLSADSQCQPANRAA
jgi:hypothetical protein